MTEATKLCTHCGELKLVDLFYPRRDGKPGVQGRCRRCQSRAVKLWRYGLKYRDWVRMHAEQHGLCKICHRPETTHTKTRVEPDDLSVDHCHATGVVRGLLCGQCNTGLGKFDDDPVRLRAAASYLEAVR